MGYFSVSSFLAGIPVGAAFCLTLGPVFFSLIKNSIEHGTRAAISMATGVTLADVLLLLFAFSGVETMLPQNGIVENVVEIIGGGFLIALGIAAILKRVDTGGGTIAPRQSVLKYISLGFFLNILNPVNFAEWIGTASYLKVRLGYSTMQSISFFTGALLAVWLVEAAIGLFATRLKNYLTPRMMRNFNVATGILFLLCGVYLLYRAAF